MTQETLDDPSFKKAHQWLIKNWFPVIGYQRFKRDDIYRHFSGELSTTKNEAGEVTRAEPSTVTRRKKYIAQALTYMVNHNALSLEGDYFRLVNVDAGEVRWWEQPDNEDDISNIKLPCQLEEYCYFSNPLLGIVAGATNAGKGHPLGTLVLTQDRWKKIEELVPGDSIFNAEGKPSKVVKVFQRGLQDCYRFHFNDGTTITADEDHIWKVLYCGNRLSIKTGHGNPNQHYGEWQEVTTKDLVKHCGIGKLGDFYKVVVPTTKPVEFAAQDVILDPYLLGLLLGNGVLRRKSSTMISTANPEVLKAFTDAGYQINQSNKYDYRVLGLEGKHSYDKRVPTQYLWNSVDVRKAILAGLLDTDGSIDQNNGIEYSTSSEGLAQDVAFLARSLGARVTMSSRLPHFTYKGERKVGHRSWRLHIKFSCYNPFRVTVKAGKWYPPKKRSDRIVYVIEPAGKQPTICIQTDDPTGLYIAEDFIVSHNTSFLVKAIQLNYEQWGDKMHFFCREGFSDLKEKFQYLKIPIPPKFHTYRRFDNFQDVVVPDGFNVIDYLKVDTNAMYHVEHDIEAILRRLTTGGVALIGMQKPPGRDTAYGGEFTKMDCTFYISIDKLPKPFSAKIKFVKVKKPKPNQYDIYRRYVECSISHGADMQRTNVGTED